MTNAGLQAALKELGDRVCVIIIDNDRRIRIGYTDSPIKSVNDIQYKTWGGTDFFGFSTPSVYSIDKSNGVTHTNWHKTECIQQICAMDTGFEDYRMDPMMC